MLRSVASEKQRSEDGVASLPSILHSAIKSIIHKCLFGHCLIHKRGFLNSYVGFVPADVGVIIIPICMFCQIGCFPPNIPKPAHPHVLPPKSHSTSRRPPFRSSFCTPAVGHPWLFIVEENHLGNMRNLLFCSTEVRAVHKCIVFY